MAKDTQKAVPLTEEQLIERESALKIAEQKLSDDQANFVLEQNKFEEEKEAFETEKAQFKADIDFFQKRKADLEAREKALEEKSEVKSEKKVDPVAFEFEGEKYQFTDDAPQLINYGGQPFSQKEISENEEVLIQFIGGNSSLIIKK
ncbi:hypothetical protein [Empedobacter sp.]|uniref:hypothetical protein n=1 Tax=Empedobacter sp. TaxID=1927715 RepID=UPI0028A95B59|nr:hypothetical protein [Empedobacter sp.]